VIPIRDLNPTQRVPVITIGLIAANVLVFLLWQPTFGTQAEQQLFYFCHAEISWETSHQENLAQGRADAQAAIDADFGPGVGAQLQPVLQRECPDKSWVLSIFVAMFLHGGWLHLGGNMLFLWIFGNNVEDRLGYVVYPLFYVMGGLAAAGLQLAFGPNSTIPSLGASGAIGAILGAYLVLFPRARVLTLFFFFIITWFELPASIVLLAWFGLQLFSGVGGLASHVSGGVAYWAHVGGFAFGALVAWIFYRRGGTSNPARYEIPQRPDPY